MKKLLLFFLLSILFFPQIYSQTCLSPGQITATDTSICAFDTTTLSYPELIDSVTITSPPVNNNGQDGNMFNITATNTIRIKYFEGNIANTPSVTTQYFIYYKVGTHVGFENNSAAWTLIAGPISFNPNAPNTYSRIPYEIGITIPAGQTYAFYLTNTSAITNNNRYHTGTATGTVLASNTDLTLYEGTGGAYPFGTFFNARPWEGNIIYDYPTSYLWSTGDTLSSIQVNPGSTTTYYCTATIPICSVMDSIIINVDPTPVVNLGNDTSICVGQSINLDAGNPGDNFQWSNGDTTQIVSIDTAGIQMVTVTNSYGCSADDSIAILLNSLPVVNYTISPNDTLCEGDPVTLSGTGATNYFWTGGITDANPFNAVSSDSYVVTGIDGNGCSDTAVATIFVYPAPITSFIAFPNDSICVGESLSLSGTGASSYLWTGGILDGVSFSPPTSGTYDVVGTNINGCTSTASASITVSSLPVVSLGSDIVQPNPPANLDAGPGYSSYLWSTSETTQTIIANSNGTYFVTVSNAEGCLNSDTVQVTFTAGIFNMNGSEAIIELYPIPTDGILNLHIKDLQASWVSFEITDLKGNVVRLYTEQNISTDYLDVINVTDLSSGMYILNVKTKGSISSIRFIRK